MRVEMRRERGRMPRRDSSDWSQLVLYLCQHCDVLEISSLNTSRCVCVSVSVCVCVCVSVCVCVCERECVCVCV